MFRHIATAYATHHGANGRVGMSEGLKCSDSDPLHRFSQAGQREGDLGGFAGGIQNSFARIAPEIEQNGWEEVKGDMGDFSYLHHGCFDIRVEVGCCFYPRATELETEWAANKEALTFFCEEVHDALHGRIVDETGAAVANHKVAFGIVDGMGEFISRGPSVLTNAEGHFWRLLNTEEEYTLHVRKAGYQPLLMSIPSDAEDLGTIRLQVDTTTPKPVTSATAISTPNPVTSTSKLGTTTKTAASTAPTPGGHVTNAAADETTASATTQPTRNAPADGTTAGDEVMSTRDDFHQETFTTTTTTTEAPKLDRFPEYPSCKIPHVGFYHHDQAFLEDFLDEVAKSHPHLASRATLPGSVPLHYLRLTSDPTVAHPDRPMFKYIANMHGDEVIGRECLFHFMR